MGENASEEKQLVKIEEMSLEETQLAEQLYNSAGLDPVVDEGLKDYDKRLQQENKLINKILGPRGSDIRGYGEAVAKRAAFAIYALLNKQYGGKVGDLRSYIMTLEDERDRSNTKYDELMGRVVGILGDEYKELRTDSKAFIERLTTTLGEDLKESKIDYGVLAERLADIDGLRSQIKTLAKEKEQLKERYESQITAFKNEHNEERRDLRSQIKTLAKEKEQLTESSESQITERDSKIKGLESEITTLASQLEQLTESSESQITERDSKMKGLESEKTTLASELEQLRADYTQLKTTLTSELEQLRADYNRLKAAITIAKAIPYEEIGEKLREGLYTFLLKDSKVPGMVIDGVGKFIDFKKYLGIAAGRGAKEACKHTEEILRKELGTTQ